MIPSEDLAAEWVRFLSDIDRVRKDLHCSNSLAWFRGHADSDWKLVPSLFRYGIDEDPDDRTEIRRRQREIDGLKADWQESLLRKTELKRRQKTRDSVKDAVPFEPKEGIATKYHAACDTANKKRAELAEARRALARYRAPVNGERELFDEFIFRAGKTPTSNSWEVLAEMRHFGVPTRLLDWTDRLDIALYFALERFRDANPTDGKLVSEAQQQPAIPCIWVLNPYNLSRRVANRTAVWNLALDPTHDYYRLILQDREWRYDEPIPTYPPAPLERVRAQRGYFTVFGNSKRDMEAQLGGGLKCLGKVPIPLKAAKFCLNYLSRIQGLSPFEVFRDLDSLGRELVDRLVRIQKR